MFGNADPRRQLARSGGERIALHRPDRHADASLAQEVRRRHAEADGEPVARDRRTGRIGYADSPALDPQPVGVKSEIGLVYIVPDENVEQPGSAAKMVTAPRLGPTDDDFQPKRASPNALARPGPLWES